MRKRRNIIHYKYFQTRITICFYCFFVIGIKVILGVCTIGSTSISFPPNPYFQSKCIDDGCVTMSDGIIHKWQERKLWDEEKVVGDVASRLFDFSETADDITLEVLDYNLRNFMQHIYCDKCSRNLSQYSLSWKTLFNAEENQYKNTYNVTEEYFAPESTTSHHGLRIAPNEIKEYIRHRDIIDIGAFNGDSMLVLHPYTDQRVFCYEIEKRNYDDLLENMRRNHINTSKVIPVHKGLSDREYSSFSTYSRTQSSESSSGSEDQRVEMATLDREIDRHNMTLGFIKADVEGLAMHIMNGCRKAIARQRPVLFLHCYHNFDEYWGLAQMVLEMENYIIQYRADSDNFWAMSETALFAYPAEIMYERYLPKPIVPFIDIK